MPPIRRKGKMKEDVHTSTSVESEDPGAPPKESIVMAPLIDSATTSPTFQSPGKIQHRKILRLKCPTCDDYPDGFRSEHELRRYVRSNRLNTPKAAMTLRKELLQGCIR